MNNPRCVDTSDALPRAAGWTAPCEAAARAVFCFGRRLPAGRGGTPRLKAAVVLVALVIGCAPKTRIGPPDPSHPASPEAPEAIVPEPASALRGSSLEGGVRETAPETSQGHGMMHGGGGSMHHGRSEMGVSGAGEPKNSLAYVCPMHPDVRRSKPSTCPRCGMVLVRKDSPSEQPERSHEE